MINSNSPSPAWKANTDHEEANKKGVFAQLFNCPLCLCMPIVPHVQRGSSENPLHSVLPHGRDARLVLRTLGLVGVHKLLVLGEIKEEKKPQTISDASL